MFHLELFTHLALKQLETGTSTSADMAELVFITIVSNNGRCITSTDDDSGTLLDGLDRCILERLRSSGKCWEFEHTRRTV